MEHIADKDQQKVCDLSSLLPRCIFPMCSVFMLKKMLMLVFLIQPQQLSQERDEIS